MRRTLWIICGVMATTVFCNGCSSTAMRASLGLAPSDATHQVYTAMWTDDNGERQKTKTGSKAMVREELVQRGILAKDGEDWAYAHGVQMWSEWK